MNDKVACKIIKERLVNSAQKKIHLSNCFNTDSISLCKFSALVLVEQKSVG